MKNFAYSKNNFGYNYELTPSGLVEKAMIASTFCGARWMTTRC